MLPQVGACFGKKIKLQSFGLESGLEQHHSCGEISNATVKLNIKGEDKGVRKIPSQIAEYIDFPENNNEKQSRVQIHVSSWW